MKYDFDEPVNRRGTGSLKWNVPENVLAAGVPAKEKKWYLR